GSAYPRRIRKECADRPAHSSGRSRRGRALSLLAGGGRCHRDHACRRGRRALVDDRASPLDAETKVAERPHDHKDELRLWLRLFTCKELIESEVRKHLREDFQFTLPRFDLMAQLDRAHKGMTLGELSQRMMVTNGNVTGLVERL